MKNIETQNLFIFSALCFFVANNLHFISGNAFVPRLLDLAATALLVWGFVSLFRESK